MDVNFSSNNVEHISNPSKKLPETKQEAVSEQTNTNEEPQITPDSAILRAYAGILEPKKTVSKEEVINYLKDNGIANEQIFNITIDALTEKDGTISLFALNTLKQFLPKIQIRQTISLLNNTKENGTFNKQAIQLVDSLIPKEKTPFGAQIKIGKILEQFKDKDGSFNKDAMNLFLRHNEELAPLLKIRADIVFKALKNKNNEFCKNAIKYLKNSIIEGQRTATLIHNLLTGKDKNGNFNINILEMEQYLKDEFETYQIPTVKNVLATFKEEENKERNDFLEFAKSLKDKRDFNTIISFIQEHKSDNDSNSNLAYNKESAEFVKKMLSSTMDDTQLASMVYKNLNMPFQEYTDEFLNSIKNFCLQVPENREMFLNASKNKTGEQKGKLNLETLDKYRDLRLKTLFMEKGTIQNIISYLSLEEDNKALDIVNQLYSIKFRHKYTTEKLDHNMVDLALKVLCDYDTKNNCPRQKCNSNALNKIEELLNNEELCKSEYDFTQQLQKIINDTVKEQYLEDSNADILSVKTNDNNNAVLTILEIPSGENSSPLTTLYDLSKGKITTQTQEVKDGKFVTIIQKDFTNKTTTEMLYEHIPIGAPLSQKTSKYDKNGNLLFTQTIENSPIKNVHNVTKRYADGTEEKICNAYKTPEGNDVIEKHMTSFDGTKTDYRYEDDILGNRITDYKITDKNGKVLMNQSTTFEVIDKNHFVSSRNNKKFDIKYNGTNINVTNMQTNETVTIELESFTNMTYEKLLPTLKSFPGDELFKMKKLNLNSMSVDESVDNACFNYAKKTIKTRESYIDLSVLLHEWGHAKDEMEFSEINEAINKDQKLRQIFEEERTALRENIGDAQQSFVDYFCADTHYLGKDNSIVEGIAETNSLLSTYPKNNTQDIRSLYWQQYFPRTIAYLSTLLN